jgi:heat shock protein HspQ
LFLNASRAYKVEFGAALRHIDGKDFHVEEMKTAKFAIGQVVRHRLFPFRGVIYDVDPQFANTEEWYEAIPAEVRPRKDQPFYHLLAENAETEYIAYVSEQNLLEDQSGEPVRHPQIGEIFDKTADGRYRPKSHLSH